MFPISLLYFCYTYFYLLNYASKDHLLTTHTYNDIYETELRPILYKCYQVRIYLSSPMAFMKQLTCIKSDDIC